MHTEGEIVRGNKYLTMFHCRIHSNHLYTLSSAVGELNFVIHAAQYHTLSTQNNIVCESGWPKELE